MERPSLEKKIFHQDSDVHVSLEDQQKINSFARCNAKFNDIEAEIIAKQSELKNLEDASEELVLMEDSDTPTIPFLHGEVFICLNMTDTQKYLDIEKKKVKIEITELQDISEELKSALNTLRTQLYAKFGNHISLGQ